MKQFELSIDHPVLASAKMGFDTCLKRAIAKAIGTGSMEGSATLKVIFEISDVIDKTTGEMNLAPLIKFKCQYSVPMKEGVEGTVTEPCRIMESQGGWMLVNGQIRMEELLENSDI